MQYFTAIANVITNIALFVSAAYVFFFGVCVCQFIKYPQYTPFLQFRRTLRMEDGGGGHTGIQDLVPYIHPIILACILFSIFYEWSSKSNVSILYIITLVLGLLFYWPDPSAPYSKRDLNNLQAESYKQAQDFFARGKSKPVNQSVNRF